MEFSTEFVKLTTRIHLTPSVFLTKARKAKADIIQLSLDSAESCK